MNQMDTNVVFVVQMLCQKLGTIDRTVLPAGTTERHLQVRKIAFNEPLYMMVHQSINGLQERKYLAVFFEKIDHRLVETGKGFVLLILTGIMGRTAVEDVSASVTGLIVR